MDLWSDQQRKVYNFMLLCEHSEYKKEVSGKYGAEGQFWDQPVGLVLCPGVLVRSEGISRGMEPGKGSSAML